MFIKYTTTKMTSEKCYMAKLKRKKMRLTPTLTFFFWVEKEFHSRKLRQNNIKQFWTAPD